MIVKKATSGLKYQVGKAAKFIGQQAVQLHGGMGVTDELNVGHFFQKINYYYYYIWQYRLSFKDDIPSFNNFTL